MSYGRRAGDGFGGGRGKGSTSPEIKAIADELIPTMLARLDPAKAVTQARGEVGGCSSAR